MRVKFKKDVGGGVQEVMKTASHGEGKDTFVNVFLPLYLNGKVRIYIFFFCI